MALTIASATFQASCGEKLVNIGKGERILKQKIGEGTGADVAALSCPKKVKARKGASFRCVVKGADGSHVKITVVQKDDKGDIAFDEPDLMHPRDTERGVETFLRDRGVSASARCPEVALIPVGGSVDCRVIDSGGASGRIRVTRLEKDGPALYKLLPN